MQLILAFLGPTERSQNHPRSSLASKPWDQLDEASRTAALEILARLIARMAATDSEKASTND
jgi:hypothetical protein